jgi:D-alanyl-D-alanine carboxypeptidase/D-alanyl-D-alanine-endopeptidase (penicillin-binding protein 4)
MNIKRSFCLLVSMGVVLAASVQAWGNGLPQGLSEALLKTGIPQEAVAIYVQPVDGGSPLLNVNTTQPMNPASTMKLVTTYAALESLGPAYTWKTALWAAGEIHDGKLQGDLVIRGGGDPFLTLERIWLMQRALREKGVHEISGNLVLDLSLYELPPLDPGAFDGEPLAAYNAVPSPLIANFNAQNIRLIPAAEAVAIQSELPLAGMKFTSQLRLKTGSCNGWQDGIQTSLALPAANEVLFEGSYPRACGEKTLPLNLFQQVGRQTCVGYGACEQTATYGVRIAAAC